MLSTQYIYGWSLKPEQILYLLQFKIDFVGCQLLTFFDELYVRKLLTWLCGGGGFLQTWGIFNLKVMLTTQSFLSLVIDNPSKLHEIDWIFQGEKYLLAHLLTMFIPTRLGSRTTYILTSSLPQKLSKFWLFSMKFENMVAKHAMCFRFFEPHGLSKIFNKSPPLQCIE